MHNKDELKKELLKVFDYYMMVYFRERDRDKTFSLFGSDLSGFGTGIDEIARGAGRFRELYLRDFEQAPDTIEVVYDFTDAVCLSETSGIVSAVISISSVIAEMPFDIKGLRISTALSKETGVWLIEHMHISLPAIIHEEGESYPLKELEERNRVLEKMVAVKTAELEERNINLQRALMQVNQLKGMLPICASCKKIRDDEGYWHQVEVFIKEHSDAEFTHSICPECREKLYPGLSKRMNV